MIPNGNSYSSSLVLKLNEIFVSGGTRENQPEYLSELNCIDWINKN